MDRRSQLPVLGKINEEAGEFWVSNPFMLQKKGANLSAFERNRLFLNQNGQGFIDASFASNADIDSDSRSVVVADFNGDQTPDLLVASAGGGPLRLFLNRMEQGNRVEIVLQGNKSNRPGIGARVIAEVDGMKIVRDLFPANGFMGSSPAWLSLGIGSAESIQRLTIRWPSGKIQELSDVKIGGRLLIEEP